MSDDAATDFRAWISAQADEYNVPVDDLLIQSKRRDPMWKGTAADHKKAKWFADLWRKATEGRDEKRIHVRGVHYYILELDVAPPTDCSWSVYRNTMTCYNYLESAAVLARILGYIPLDGIVDQKHGQRVVTEYGKHRRRVNTDGIQTPTGVSVPSIPDPYASARLQFDPHEETFAEYAADRLAGVLVQAVEFDRPSQAPFHIELWSEKTLPDYITGSDASIGIAEELGVNVVVEGQGDLSLTIAHNLAERIQAAGKPAVILYLSDFDPKGTEMARNMAAKVAWLKQRGDIQERVCIDQLAVTPEQIREFDLPRKPIEGSSHTGTGGKSYNTKINEWEQERGVGATELNALENRPDDFKRIVREGVGPFTDPDLASKNRDAREQWHDRARDAVLDALDEADVDDQLGELRRWCSEFNAEYDRAEPMLESLRALQRDGFLAEWEAAVDDAVRQTEFPLADVPHGEAAYPDDPLYDTAREYVENLMRITRDGDGDSQQ